MSIKELQDVARSLDYRRMGHFLIVPAHDDGRPVEIGPFKLYHHSACVMYDKSVAWNEGEEIIVDDAPGRAYRRQGFGHLFVIQMLDTRVIVRHSHGKWYCVTDGGPREPKSRFFVEGRCHFLGQHLPIFDDRKNLVTWEKHYEPIAPKGLGRLLAPVAFLKTGEIMVEGDMLPSDGDVDLGYDGFSIARYSGTTDVFFYSAAHAPSVHQDHRHQLGALLTYSDGQWFQVTWAPKEPPSLAESLREVGQSLQAFAAGLRAIAVYPYRCLHSKPTNE